MPFFEGVLTDLVVERRPGLSEKEREFGPVVSHILDCLSPLSFLLLLLLGRIGEQSLRQAFCPPSRCLFRTAAHGALAGCSSCRRSFYRCPGKTLKQSHQWAMNEALRRPTPNRPITGRPTERLHPNTSHTSIQSRETLPGTDPVTENVSFALTTVTPPQRLAVLYYKT